ncbi:SDR family NAD(P)-dependent oxidoreductase [Sediminibacterium sp.]|uniref:SDR family NAD(P)-dependent oxidoreductase n=1 Tax=Sediminibacterium sp. TaxID=1917865 RepID=UPI003F71C21F
MFSLTGKKILVTGASAGIGKAIAEMTSQAGAVLTLLGRDAGRLEKVKTGLHGEGHKTVSFDLTDERSISEFAGQAEIYDGIVYNAGIIDYFPIKFSNSKKIANIMDVNFTSVVTLNQLLVKNKRLNKKTSLVFISSISANIGVPGTAIYAASKAAVCAYMRVVASELAGQQIRSNSISPGIVASVLPESLLDKISDIAADEKKYPLGYGKPEDVAGLALYLLSDKSSWMTGTDIKIDGGYSLQ